YKHRCAIDDHLVHPACIPFRIVHNLVDSPYSSPSPFAVQTRSAGAYSSAPSMPSSSINSRHPRDACRCCPRCARLPPASASTSASAAWRRRRSTSTPATAPSDAPKKGYEDYVKHPENVFILFHCKCYKNRTLASTSTSASALSSPLC
ncbi:hypothetical protein B0H11DRAFT_2109111, partial [Mycena galericulata]